MSSTPPNAAGIATLFADGLALPVLHLFMVFLARNLIDRDGEAWRAGGGGQFTAQVARQRVQLRRWQVTQVSLRQLGLDLAQLLPQGRNAVAYVSVGHDNDVATCPKR